MHTLHNLKKIRLAIVLISLFVVSNILSIPLTLACTCMGSSSPEEEMKNSDAIFEGIVTNTEVESSSGILETLVATFQVTQIWKGSPSETLTIRTAVGGSWCGFGFEKSERYLVYATINDSDSTLRTTLCSLTKRYDNASEDVSALGNPLWTHVINIFNDVSSTNPFSHYIDNLKLKGIVSGVDGNFFPTAHASRGEIAKMIVLTRQLPLSTNTTPVFSDVEPTNPFYQYIQTAHEHNIVTGFSDGTFQPFTYTTRGQIATMIFRAFLDSQTAYLTPFFSDVPVSRSDFDAIQTVADDGVMTGYGHQLFGPDDFITREQLSKILVRASWME